MQEKKVRKTTIYLPSEIVDALKQKAKDNRRSFNSEIVWALQRYLGGDKEEKHEQSS